ncbi:hypothetical protein [Lactococcus garvieae]|uniref:hypothetical protein n=1 Tax=Lactococcus garvieae TaxID=1363 RepID=UPI0012FD4AA5|nr:hypothetical protein [Lactococcus garvieae]
MMKGKTMDTQELIARSESQIDDFKKKSEIILKDNINQEIIKNKNSFSKDIWDEELALEVEKEVEKKIANLNNSIDLNPTSVYFALKAESALNPEITEQELNIAAYQFLYSKTKNKFMKKILKEKINKIGKGENK